MSIFNDDKLEEKILGLIQLLKEENLDELEIFDNGLRIRVKNKQEYTRPIQVTPDENYAGPKKEEKSVVSGPLEKTIEEETPANRDYIKAISSPMVGTFYNRPSPDAETFTELGNTIKKEDTLCLIEAMKLFNEIKSEYAGKVIKQLVQNHTPVEFGTELYWIDTRNESQSKN